MLRCFVIYVIHYFYPVSKIKFQTILIALHKIINRLFCQMHTRQEKNYSQTTHKQKN